jgi:phosphoribosylcarboxyaminoimidazole (NCAIR) mutase
VGINAAANAANLAAQILSLSDPALAQRFAAWRQEQSTRVDTFE